MTLETIPILKTKKLVLVPLDLKHAESYEKNFLDYEVIRYLSHHVPWPYPKNGVKEYIQTFILPRQGNDYWAWAITQKTEPNEVIGCIDFWRNGNPENRGFWLGRNYWGQGLMTEAATVTTKYAFENLGFEKLIFANALGNDRSRRIKEKAGAELIDIRPAKFVDPKFTQHEVWELKKENYIR